MRMRCAVLACVGVLAAAPSARAFTATYDQKVTGRGMTMMSKVTLKDNQLRMESQSDAGSIIIFKNPQGMFSYMPAEGMAMSLSSLEQFQKPLEKLDDYDAYLKEAHAKYLRSETVNGLACDVYEFADSSGETTTAWVWKERQFPVRAETMTKDGKVTVEMSNITLGGSVPDSAFQLPPGVQVMDMGAMIKGLKGLPVNADDLGDLVPHQ